ncbi:response regulator [Nodosilinea sp. LEGE 07088]|uniref:response regulator n=1 Tax=Nodosilinea sp. LEGE 07088 TaxID=2777968 RepID=UPI001881ABEB|nr:response regulator [Nodosilinea sp. LEGE 07088]MBE9140174.1 response regulator [Nodosilinea sp. LEGE 07088]
MKILLVEDDSLISDWLIGTLSAHRYTVDAIADGAAGLDMALCWPYDLVILDWVLPSLDGPEVCRRLRAQGSHTPILMLTVKGASDDIVAGLDAGADDYLAKTGDASQLLARVRALLRRNQGVASPLLTWGELCLDPALTQVTCQQRPVACRPKEYELLELFMRYPQRLLTRSAIIDHLWPMDDTPVDGSVTNLIKDLRQRLKGAGLVANPIETVYGLGYRLRPAPQGDSEPLPSAPARLEGVMQQATQRFQTALEQRLKILESAIEAVENDHLSLQQRQLAQTEVHKLAGGLALFGYTQAAAVAEDLEALLSSSQQPPPLRELAQRLSDLKRSLTLP